jgi:hypothetical protein
VNDEPERQLSDWELSRGSMQHYVEAPATGDRRLLVRYVDLISNASYADASTGR